MWNAQTVGFLAWLNPHQPESRFSIHNFFFFLKLVFLRLILDFSSLLSFFKRHSLKAMPWKSSGRHSVSSFTFLWNYKKPNCNRDAFNKNSFFFSRFLNESIESSKITHQIGIRQLALEHFSSLSLGDNQESQNAKGTKEWNCLLSSQSKKIRAIIGKY